jgi:hypothetical protein
MYRSIAIALSCVLLSPHLAVAKPAARPAAQNSSANSALDEVRRSFTIGGKPIPPEIFRDMGDGNLADGASILVSVDLKAAPGSNLYYDDITQAGGWVSQKKIDKAEMNGAEETAYHFVGATSNKLLAVVASYNGGGSGTFYTLHILDLAAAKAFDSEGKVYDRINLTALREVALGDRWDGAAKISGNMIEIRTTRQGPADDSGKVSTKRIEARRP